MSASLERLAAVEAESQALAGQAEEVLAANSQLRAANEGLQAELQVRRRCGGARGSGNSVARYAC